MRAIKTAHRQRSGRLGGTGSGVTASPHSSSVGAGVLSGVLADPACAAVDGAGAPWAIAVTAALRGEFGASTPK